MKLDPIAIINASNNWSEFEGFLLELGDAPNFKKLKGDAFEFLTKFFLQTDPIFCAMFEKVYHNSEIPISIRDELRLPHPEVGVDLIAKYKDGSYCAIQCKFHQKSERNISYQEVSTFFSITERTHTYSKLSHRIICTSANEISNKVKKLHPEKLGFLTYSDFFGMDEQRFKQIHQIIKGKKLTLIPFKPRSHQTTAISKTDNYFADLHMDRGKIIHPCGAGKSLTAYWIAKKLAVKTVLIAVPSLALVKQTLGTWSRQALADGKEIDYIAVCSDKDVGKSDDPLINTHDIGISVTTNSNTVKQFLNSKSQGLKVVITTYQSGETIISASQISKIRFNLGIFDEAHKTTGDRSKRFALLLQDNKIHFEKKIFMTATERRFIGDSNNLMSMDDEKTYGKVIDQLSFHNALEQIPPILCDYRVVTVAVNRKEIEEIITENQLTKIGGKNWTFTEDGATIAALIAHRKLSKDHKIKHAISFHKSIKRAQEFSELSNHLKTQLGVKDKVSAFHVSGKMGTGARDAEIRRFCDTSPSIISNARCLTEGVDIPIVDAVIFADPKQSLIDIVQAAGRAMRTHPNKKLGHIIIPVILDEQSSDKVNDAFKQIVNVVAALGINDERIIDEAKQIVKSKFSFSGKILELDRYMPEAELEFKNLVDNIKLKIWDRVSFAKSAVGEGEFNKWMQNNTKLSNASMEKYSRAVRKISNDLVKLHLSYSSLEEITANADLEKLKEEYFSIQEFHDLDERGNRMYSAGFNRLIEFQKSQNSAQAE